MDKKGKVKESMDNDTLPVLHFYGTKNGWGARIVAGEDGH